METHDHAEHFTPVGRPQTIDDGQGGSLTAAVGVRFPTADGAGQIVFFWHNSTFLGWDSNLEGTFIELLEPDQAGVFVASYRHYAPSDALCCPSLPPVTVSYRWTEGQLVANGTPPSWADPVRVIRLSS